MPQAVFGTKKHLSTMTYLPLRSTGSSKKLEAVYEGPGDQRELVLFDLEQANPSLS